MRIWTKEELEKADFGEFDKVGNFYPFKGLSCILTDMFGQSVELCKKNGYNVSDWMIAKPTQQEPKEGDLVYVWDKDEKPKHPEKRIFVANVKYGCVCVVDGYEEEYRKGEYFSCNIWKNYELVPKPTAQEIADKVGLTLEELRSIVNN